MVKNNHLCTNEAQQKKKTKASTTRFTTRLINIWKDCQVHWLAIQIKAVCYSCSTGTSLTLILLRLGEAWRHWNPDSLLVGMPITTTSWGTYLVSSEVADVCTANQQLHFVAQRHPSTWASGRSCQLCESEKLETTQKSENGTWINNDAWLWNCYYNNYDCMNETYIHNVAF